MKIPLRGIDFMQCGGVAVKAGREWLTAVLAVSSAIGIGIVPDRAVVFFFSQMGRASWIGVFMASLLFGVLCAMAAWAASEMGSRSFDGVCRLLSGRWMAALYQLFMLSVAAIMLAEAGKLAMLALPVRNAFWMGMTASLGLSAALCMRGMRMWGIASIGLCAAFYLALGLDPRPVRFAVRYETVLALRDSVSAAMLLSVLYAALSASVAAGEAASGGVKSPLKLAAWAGGMMFLLLSVANTAFLRGGEKLLSQTLPTVVLSARWGKTGFYGCIFVKWMCILCTLNSAVRVLVGKTLKSSKS